MKMFGGVLVPGGIAAADVAALQTETKVNPIVAHFQTLLTALRSAWGDIADLIKVGTLFHVVSSCYRETRILVMLREKQVPRLLSLR
ncbi:MAG TPA: hypothetical protein VMF56_14965 [Acidobacteriaceae bacterium]|nr:hypothetical protein [Acidobacteriaceae bacterium]